MRGRARRWWRFVWWSAFCMAAVTAGGQRAGGQGNDVYTPVPSRFGLPERQEILAGWMGFDPNTHGPSRSRMNESALRAHVWRWWAALTSPGGQTHASLSGGLPVWATWYTGEETFAAGTEVIERRDAGGFGRGAFKRPKQVWEEGEEERGSVPAFEIAARTLFNREAHSHIRREKLHTKARLQELFDAKAPVPDFPRGAVALKTQWIVMKANSCQTIPVWDGETTERSGAHVPDSWPRKVAVRNGSGPFDAACASLPQVEPTRFFHIRAEADSPPGSIRYKAGDFILLLGFHLATREIPNWVWGTFWWHDAARDGIYGADMPRSVRGAWRNYRMDAAFDMDRPWQHHGEPKIAFNPYLEAQMVRGVQSNCMTCHRRAIYPRPENAITLHSWEQAESALRIVVSGSEAATAAYLPAYERSLKTSFLWSIVLSAR
jgi:hypothetical protein